MNIFGLGVVLAFDTVLEPAVYRRVLIALLAFCINTVLVLYCWPLTTLRQNITSVVIGNVRLVILACVLYSDRNAGDATILGIVALLALEVFFAVFTRQKIVKEIIFMRGGALHKHETRVNCVALNQSANVIVSADDNKEVVVWDSTTCEPRRVLEGHKGWINALCVDTAGTVAVSGSLKGELFLWDLKTYRRVLSYRGHTGSIKMVCFNQDCQLLASVALDGKVMLWETQSGQCISCSGDEKHPLLSVCFINDFIVCGSHKGVLTLKSVDAHRCTQTINAHTMGINSLCVNPEHTLVASCSSDKSVNIYSISGESLKEVQKLSFHTAAVNDVQFSADGTLLATASSDRSICIFSAKTWGKIRVFNGHSDTVSGVSFGDELKLVSSSLDTTLRIWDVGVIDGRTPITPKAHADLARVTTLTDIKNCFRKKLTGRSPIDETSVSHPIGNLAGNTAEANNNQLGVATLVSRFVGKVKRRTAGSHVTRVVQESQVSCKYGSRSLDRLRIICRVKWCCIKHGFEYMQLTQASSRKSTIGHAVSVKSQTAKLTKMLSAKRKERAGDNFGTITPPLACAIEQADKAEVGHLLMKSEFEAAHVETVHAEHDQLQRNKVLKTCRRGVWVLTGL